MVRSTPVRQQHLRLHINISFGNNNKSVSQSPAQSFHNLMWTIHHFVVVNSTRDW